MFRRGLAGLLRRHAELEVVGEAANASELLEVASRLRPAVVVLEAGIPGGYEEVSDELLRQVVGVSVLTLGSTLSVFHATRALFGGTSGYVLKEAEPELLAAAIVAAAHGYVVSPRAVMQETCRGRSPLTHLHHLLDGLSPREFEVLRDLATGMTTKALANRLKISEKTVRNHIASMYAKLGVHDRAQLLRYAIQKGLPSDGPGLAGPGPLMSGGPKRG
jgi:DNA-binding NarL/FixJ family response regulator